MHLNFPALALCLSLAAATGGARADERWVHVGDLQFMKPWVTGRLSIDLSSLRKRAHHYEVWQRIAIEVDKARAFAATPDEDPRDRLVLWAIHCRRGSMARITEGVPGSFEPRAERLKFYVPAPNGAGAAVVDTACAEVRRLAAESSPQPPETPDSAAVVQPRLDQPPVTFDDEDAEEE